jgi:hypothetical protein
MVGREGFIASLACRLARCPGQRQMLRQLAFGGIRLRPLLLQRPCLIAARSNPAVFPVHKKINYAKGSLFFYGAFV